uniref:Uncharacterized protein n=1 Tax=Rousettus aegyptiacus TaxID=9407 RepID=A0A7J8C288_ROUAE|nr:hypothetical protein HJG63_009304 [Rousettus aegyptiacus]
MACSRQPSAGPPECRTPETPKASPAGKKKKSRCSCRNKRKKRRKINRGLRLRAGSCGLRGKVLSGEESHRVEQRELYAAACRESKQVTNACGDDAGHLQDNTPGGKRWPPGARAGLRGASGGEEVFFTIM